ncbi:MAG: sigma-54-dependent transcriptional regulator, partial [Thermodesulfobacteriota bacterium]
VDDELNIRELLKHVLQDYCEVLSASNGPEAIDIVRSSNVDLVLLDLMLPGMDGMEVLEKIKRIEPQTGVIIISAVNSAPGAVRALKKGAYDYVTKPFDNEDLLSAINRYMETTQLSREVTYLKEELKEYSYCEIIGKSKSMKNLFEVIEKVSGSSTSVLITGESGTGKELVARAIQARGDRHDKPFVAVNCGAVPGELMESELFGHEKGAFTGAHARKIGKFEYAEGGTVFLDEVSTLPMQLQIKLLRVLQEKTFERVGGVRSIKVDVRILAATNIDLEAAVRKGLFRKDLYYRLNVVPIELPPLRSRSEDIPLLVRHFLEKSSKKCNKKITGITPDAMEALCNYSWPGNVRELENLIERVVVLAGQGGAITFNDLPVEIIYPETESLKRDGETDFREALRNFERDFIIGVLERTNWNRNEAARVMKVHRNTLLLKMKALGIREHPSPFKFHTH